MSELRDLEWCGFEKQYSRGFLENSCGLEVFLNCNEN